jgi:PleD family two-component response regulator
VESLRIETDKGPASVTLSLGIAEMFHAPRDGSVDDMIRRADEALYAAKKAGRNCIVIFDAVDGKVIKGGPAHEGEK